MSNNRPPKWDSVIPGGYQITDVEWSEIQNRYIEGDESIDYDAPPRPKKKYTKAEKKAIFDKLKENLEKLKGDPKCLISRKKD